jgi:hypothetical protein
MFIETILRHYDVEYESADLEKYVRNVNNAGVYKWKKVLMYPTTLGFTFGTKQNDYEQILTCNAKRKHPFVLVVSPKEHYLRNSDKGEKN